MKSCCMTTLQNLDSLGWELAAFGEILQQWRGQGGEGRRGGEWLWDFSVIFKR